MTQTVAIVTAGAVDNVIVVNDLADIETPAWRDYLGDAQVVPVQPGVAVSPGWAYDPDGDPPFTQPTT